MAPEIEDILLHTPLLETLAGVSAAICRHRLSLGIGPAAQAVQCFAEFCAAVEAIGGDPLAVFIEIEGGRRSRAVLLEMPAGSAAIN